jgi:hypothetical protein
MGSRRSPSSFAVLLAFALLPIVSMVAGGSEARLHAMEWMPWQAKAQSLAHGVRSGLGELAGHDAGWFARIPVEDAPEITVARNRLHASCIDLPVVG